MTSLTTEWYKRFIPTLLRHKRTTTPTIRRHPSKRPSPPCSHHRRQRGDCFLTVLARMTWSMSRPPRRPREPGRPTEASRSTARLRTLWTRTRRSGGTRTIALWIGSTMATGVRCLCFQPLITIARLNRNYSASKSLLNRRRMAQSSINIYAYFSFPFLGIMSIYSLMPKPSPIESSPPRNKPPTLVAFSFSLSSLAMSTRPPAM